MSAVADDIIRALGLVLSNASVYGPEHAVTRQAQQSCFRGFQQVWASGNIDIHVSDEGLSVNHMTVESKNPLVHHLADHFEDRQITNIVLKQGMTADQFSGFVEVLNAKPAQLEQLGGFGGAIEAVGLNDVVGVRKVVYREVTEDQAIVDKQHAAAEKETDAGHTTDKDRVVQEVLAFLQETGSDATGDTARKILEKGDDPGQLADLILTSADIDASQTLPETDAKISETLVERIQRAYQAMTRDPSFHTQKTKKRIQRTLAHLEEELLNKLENRGHAVLTSCETAVKDAFEAMSDELTLDALAREYTKKWKAANSSEARILRYLKRKSHESAEQSDLKARLQDGGLDDDAWIELLHKSGASSADGGKQEPIADITGIVGEVLERIRTDAALEQGTANVSQQDIQRLQDQIALIARQTEKKIQTLIEEIGGKPGDTWSRAERPTLSRKRLFEILAEIGQELCQPLSVINCSIDMVRDGSLGEVADMQKEMLDTAADSGQKIHTLINRLIDIAGTPKGMKVDKSIQASLYQN